ncbi:hypothetical protein QJQ45_003160 [Haematococcus lacustris]|nr:hypothetical protein QJQ45_003160 [Haematococcus lacustris]
MLRSSRRAALQLVHALSAAAQKASPHIIAADPPHLWLVDQPTVEHSLSAADPVPREPPSACSSAELARWSMPALAPAPQQPWSAPLGLNLVKLYSSSTSGRSTNSSSASSQSPPSSSGAGGSSSLSAVKGFVKGGFTVDMFPPERIRNFCIIAHVDHGKSTLADRLLELTGALTAGQGHHEQYLDKLQVERDRGITVKAQTVSLVYPHKGLTYLINLIDTPGHLDFSHEVSRSLAACQGALLLVDAGQGVQAQTLANWRLARDQGLVVVTALNKIDLPQAEPEACVRQLQEAGGLREGEQVLQLSAKTGQGVAELLPTLIERLPAPSGDPEAPPRLLLFDAFHDPFRGVVALVEVVDGSVMKGQVVASAGSGDSWEVLEVGLLAPERHPTGKLLTGQVGYLMTSMKDLKAARVGDTWHLQGRPVAALPGFKPARSMVYAGLYPVDAADFDALATVSDLPGARARGQGRVRAMERLSLNDASVVVQRENSDALGAGFRCGFLGMLHMEVFMQRLDQEHGTAVVTTTPTVPYLLDLGPDHELRTLSRASDYPMDTKVFSILEPTVQATIIAPHRFVGPVMQLCMARHGELLEHLVLTGPGAQPTPAPPPSPAGADPDESESARLVTAGEDREVAAGGWAPGAEGQGPDSRVLLRFTLPLSELAGSLHNELKSITHGFASFDWEEGEYRPADLRRLDIIAHGKPVDALARLVHKDEAVSLGRGLIAKMKELVPRAQFEIVLQAAVDGKVVARETIKPLRKDVTAKCYGGDISRKPRMRHDQGHERKVHGNCQQPNELKGTSRICAPITKVASEQCRTDFDIDKLYYYGLTKDVCAVGLEGANLPTSTKETSSKAYVDFIAQPEGGPQVQEFMQLLEVAPGIEEEVFAVAMQAMPDATMSWESWHQCLLAASQSPQLKEQMADRFAHSTSSSARRALAL